METNTVSLLLRVGRLIRSRMERELPVSHARCEALRLLSQDEDVTMRTVAEHFKIAAPSATALVNELVRHDYVTRVEHSSDRREVHLRLTDNGKKVLQAAAASREKVLSELLSVLSAEDRAQLDLILAKIVRASEVHPH